MRRSRGLTFKREQEQKLNSLLNKGEGRSSNVPEVEAPSKKPLALAAPVRPDARSMREAIKEIRQTKKTPVKKVIDSDEEDEEKYERNDRKNARSSREEHHDHNEEEEHDHNEEEHYDEHDYHEEEEEVKPVAKGRAMKPNNHKDELARNESSKNKQVKQEAKPSPRGRRPKVQEEEEHDRNEREERNERSERDDREDREEDDDKKRKMIIPKSFFQKMISTANIDTTSSDIYPTLQAEMIDYVVEVIKIVSNNEEDEVVVKDSNLRFLGEKGKAIGNLDVKLFEKIYSEAQKILVHNVTFTSESFKSLCKYTEIHIMEFLKKARAIMIHAGRKRLTLADIELLKFILE